MFRRKVRKAPPSNPTSSDHFVFPATAVNRKFRTFFDYWKSKAVGDKLPGRQHVDPLEMRAFLPNMMLYDVAREGTATKFRIRLFGTGLFALWQADLTGRWLNDIVPPAMLGRIEADLIDCVTAAQPRHGGHRLAFPGREIVAHERLLLPLAADGETVDMLMALYLEASPPP